MPLTPPPTFDLLGSSDSSDDSSSEGDGTLESGDAGQYSFEVEGARVTSRDDYMKNGRSHKKRYLINVCPFHGRGCTKSRAARLGVDIFGPQAAKLFLGTWVVAGVNMEAEEHDSYYPTDEEIARYASELGVAPGAAMVRPSVDLFLYSLGKKQLHFERPK